MKKPYFGSLHYHMRKLYNLPRNVSYEKKVALLNDALKVTFVRHPFVRLVSTYQDKLIEQNFLNWRQLCLKFPSSQQILENSTIPNFDQFVSFVLSMHDEPQLNPHLEFYWRKCDMCNIHFDVIGKVETVHQDMQYIFSKVHDNNFPIMYLSVIVIIFRQISLGLDLHMHQSHAGSSESLALQYFAKLNETRVKKLYQMYKLDFLMFGYDPNPYFEVAIASGV